MHNIKLHYISVIQNAKKCHIGEKKPKDLIHTLQ